MFNEVLDLKPTSQCRADMLARLSSRNGGLQTADQPKRRFENRRSLFPRYKRTYGSSITKAPKTRHICPGFALYKTFSAKGAVFTLAWGSAPGSRKCKTASATASAESAIHSRAFRSIIGPMPQSYLSRAFRARS